MPPTPRRRRWLPWAGGAAVLAVAGTTALVVHSSKPGNVSNPNVEFAKPTPTVPKPPPPKAGARHDPVFVWPFYGYDAERSKTFATADPAALHPPYSERWALRGSVLLEFPPVLGRRSLYLLKDNGALYCVSRRTGRVIWKKKLGSLAASSPAFAHDTVYVTLLKRFPGSAGGRVVAVNARTGAIRWTRNLPDRAESSPLVGRDTVFFGTENGTVFALRAHDGAVKWTYHASGAVKGGLASDGRGNLYFGDYSGHVQCVRARDGKQRWRSGTNGTAFGFGSGNFYSTAAVAYDRVYLGNTDGFVYAFGAATGRLAWRHQTGAYVYSSPAVTQVPGGGPTVYIGSYDGNLYALDAGSGRPRWIKPAGGKISGGITVLGDLVYFSTLNKRTRAVSGRNGALVWSTGRGAFNPVVSDGRRIYLVGYSSLFALTPTRTLHRHGGPARPRPPAVRRYRCLRYSRHLCVRFAHRRPAPSGSVRCLKHRGGLCVRAAPRKATRRRR